MELDCGEVEKLRQLIDSPSKRVLIVAHANPDGDAIGSSLAWAVALESKGHYVTCVVPNHYPSFLGWLDGIDRVRVFKDDCDGQTAQLINRAEVVFCMDFNSTARLELLGSVISDLDAQFVLIDHHLDPVEKFDITFSHPESCSTSFLVYKLIERLFGLDTITKSMAESLYVGIMTDTGNFSYSHLTPELFIAVSDLVSRGINISEINYRTYNSFTLDRIHLLGYSLNKIETIASNGVKIAYIYLDSAELRRFDFQSGDTEGFVNFPLTVGDITMSVFFVETRRFIRISLRSRGDVNVSDFARLYFDGGGHKNAAGGKSYRPMPETIDHFKRCVSEYFK